MGIIKNRKEIILLISLLCFICCALIYSLFMYKQSIVDLSKPNSIVLVKSDSYNKVEFINNINSEVQSIFEKDFSKSLGNKSLMDLDASISKDFRTNTGNFSKIIDISNHKFLVYNNTLAASKYLKSLGYTDEI